MILHHFRKEFRYLRLRWLVFLALLASHLAVDLEWLFPLQAGVEAPGWLGHLREVIFLTGAALLGSCPEDKPGSDRSFISTRPLPVWDYWLARVALWLLLLVAPVVVENAFYLALSGRPAGEVMAGAWRRAVYVIQITAWVLPMTALWRRGEFWVALGSLAAGWLLVDRVVDFVSLKTIGITVTYSLSSAGRTAGALLFALSLTALAWHHQKLGTATFGRRLVALLGLALACLLSALFWPWTEHEAPADQARVNRLAPGLKISLDLASYEFQGFDREFGRQMFAPPHIQTGDPAVSVRLLPQRAVVSQGELSRTSKPEIFRGSRRFDFSRVAETLMATDTVLRDLFPPGTLLTTGSERSMWGMYLGVNAWLATFEAPFPDPAAPLRVTTDFEADWNERWLELDMPLKAGSTGQTVDHLWRVLQVHQDKNEKGAPELGQVGVELHVQARDDIAGILNETKVLLWSPQRKMVWLHATFEEHGAVRAGGTGWTRHKLRLNWRHVLDYADGEDAGVDISQLHVVLLRTRFLGSSAWTWKSPDIVLQDHPFHAAQLRISGQAVYAGREIKAFQERMATLKSPAADAKEPEVRRYLYDVLSIMHATQVAYKSAAFKEVSDIFRPLLQHHLPLMLSLSADLWPGWTNRPPTSLLKEYLGEEQRETVIDLAMTNPVLISTIIQKGWAEPARRLQPRILALPKLPSQTDELLLKWGDEASHEKLIQQQRRFANDYIFAELDKVPGLRPRLESLAREIVRDEVPVLVENAYWASQRFQVAADFGDAACLDVCLRWLALGGDLPSGNVGMPRPNLLKADGSKLWQEKVDSDKQWPRYRHLTAGDFDYLPEQRAWRLRQP